MSLWSAMLLWAMLQGPAWAEEEEESPSQVVSLTWARTRAVRSEAPVLPDEAERMALSALVADLLRGAPSRHIPSDAAQRAQALGLSLERAGDRLWLVEPKGGPDPRGLAMAAIRLGPLPAELVLQAPHPYYDEHTGRIAGALFDAGGVRAAMIASAHRYAVKGSDPTGQVASALQAQTAAVPLALPDALIVQIHGFGPKRSEAHAVLSPGAARSGGSLYDRAMRTLGPALQAEGQDSDLRGPDEVPLLAAMANVQSWLLADRTRFLHIELNAEVRDRLRTDEPARERLRAALLALAARSEDR